MTQNEYQIAFIVIDCGETCTIDVYFYGRSKINSECVGSFCSLVKLVTAQLLQTTRFEYNNTIYCRGKVSLHCFAMSVER